MPTSNDGHRAQQTALWDAYKKPVLSFRAALSPRLNTAFVDSSCTPRNRRCQMGKSRSPCELKPPRTFVQGRIALTGTTHVESMMGVLHVRHWLLLRYCNPGTTLMLRIAFPLSSWDTLRSTLLEHWRTHPQQKIYRPLCQKDSPPPSRTSARTLFGARQRSPHCWRARNLKTGEEVLWSLTACCGELHTHRR